MAALSVIPQLAERLREARVKAGLSKELAAVTIGRSWSSISGYERGHTTPPLDVIEALAGLTVCAWSTFWTTSESTSGARTTWQPPHPCAMKWFERPPRISDGGPSWGRWSGGSAA
jgi:transcriptional regulator with XRE-family HTH domain